MTTISDQPAAGKEVEQEGKKQNKSRNIRAPEIKFVYYNNSGRNKEEEEEEDEQRVENVGWKKKELAAKRMRQRCIPQAPERRKQERKQERKRRKKSQLPAL